MSKWSQPRVLAGIVVLCLALFVAIKGMGGRHGNYGGVVTFLGGFLGALPGAVDGARRLGLRAPILVAVGAVVGCLLAFGIVAWYARESIGTIAIWGLVFGSGAIVIPLVIVGSALVWLTPRAQPRPDRV